MAHVQLQRGYAPPAGIELRQPLLGRVLSRVVDAMTENRRRSVLRQLRAHSFLVAESQAVIGDQARASLASPARLPFAG